MTKFATGFPQALDDGQVASRAMDGDRNWQVTFDHHDALVFSLAPNGTVIMRALRQVEWDAMLAVNQASGRRFPVSDIVRRVVSEHNATKAEPSKTLHTF